LPDGSIYTKTQPIQWAPENFGGGPGNPVPGDAYIEKWVSAVPGFNRVLKVHYKITHFGTDTHANKYQELPVGLHEAQCLKGLRANAQILEGLHGAERLEGLRLNAQIAEGLSEAERLEGLRVNAQITEGLSGAQRLEGLRSIAQIVEAMHERNQIGEDDSCAFVSVRGLRGAERLEGLRVIAQIVEGLHEAERLKGLWVNAQIVNGLQDAHRLKALQVNAQIVEGLYGAERLKSLGDRDRQNAAERRLHRTAQIRARISGTPES
jgi:hypothetical protein